MKQLFNEEPVQEILYYTLLLFFLKIVQVLMPCLDNMVPIVHQQMNKWFEKKAQET